MTTVDRLPVAVLALGATLALGWLVWSMIIGVGIGLTFPTTRPVITDAGNPGG